MAGTMKHTMVVRHPDTMMAEALLVGSKVPDWAAGIVGPDNVDGGDSGGSDGGGSDYSRMNVADLEAEVEARNDDREDDDFLVVEGTGKDGKVLKKDLVAVLEADDAASAGAE